ncbi:hypothetical protein [Lignipirellula cremea]|uniref:Uncharacterized protein n=1 Tax=Lignipirellula cremea TaxID=2528010 RepID=A0A518DPC2_9BACT|nr:hypothetical protein [Lignipirellula cremea]QDU93685.1 hypothetical protein Pla8534_14660 [Lignipirellula cremea]
MILPRFSLKALILLVTVFSLLSVVFSMAYQGVDWAIAITCCVFMVAMAPLLYVGAFALASLWWTLCKLVQPGPRVGSPFRPSSVPRGPSAPQE